MSDGSRPETPEETLARLTAYASSTGSADDRSPYQVAEPSPDPEPAPRKSRSGLTVVLVVLFLMVAGVSVVAFFAIREDATESSPNFTPQPQPSEAPTADGDWADYPGVSYLDDSEVLAGPRLEVAQAEAERFVRDYQTALTSEFGLTWTETYKPLLSQDKNGYGGSSLLYYYSSPQVQGSATVTDPAARQKVEELFHRMVLEDGATDYYLANELYADDATTAKRRFGAATQATQPMWAMRGNDAIGPFLTVRSDVADRSLRADPSWEGDVWFDFDVAGEDSLIVTLRIEGAGLLSQADEAEYRERIAAYDLTAKPEGR